MRRTVPAWVAVAAVVATFALTAWVGLREVRHERQLRRHACAELDQAGADTSSRADVAACTFAPDGGQ